MAVQPRYFNSIKIDYKLGTLTKRSTDVKKFINEVLWYKKMPSNLQSYIPRVFDFSVDKNNSYITMEYYDYSTLHDLFCNIAGTNWETIFGNLRFMMDQMSKTNLGNVDDEQIKALHEIYTNKTIDRLKQVKETFPDYYSKPFIINGEEYDSIESIIEQLPELIETRLINTLQKPFCVIHGDLCFPNILVSRKGVIKLIDPRGSFGTFDIMGDQRYEVAKLLHSIDGNYEQIIEDNFEISNITKKGYNYNINKNESLMQIFKTTFKDYDINQITLIEALLFLSMIPLHKDHLNRQYAMLATGVKLLKSVI